MPAYFDSSKCVVIVLRLLSGRASRSAVAAGGIVNVSSNFHEPSGSKENDRLCDSLSLSIQASSPILFNIGTPDLTTFRLRGFPYTLLSGLSYPTSRRIDYPASYLTIIPIPRKLHLRRVSLFKNPGLQFFRLSKEKINHFIFIKRYEHSGIVSKVLDFIKLVHNCCFFKSHIKFIEYSIKKLF